jgi:hypothetical protein
MTRRRHDPELLAVALHEAGHAVIFAALGWQGTPILW